MFRWASAQPLPAQLLEHLDHAGGFRSPWHQRESGAVLVYLAPHQLFVQGRLPLEAIRISYELTLTAAQGEQVVAIHGERLLQCTQRLLARWVPGQPLPCDAALEPVAPLEAVVTAASLPASPELAVAYQQLEQLSERGNSPADLAYASRLEIQRADALIQAWNQQQALLTPDNLQAERDRWLDLGREEGVIAAEQVHQGALTLLHRSVRLFSRLVVGQVAGQPHRMFQRDAPAR